MIYIMRNTCASICEFHCLRCPWQFWIIILNAMPKIKYGTYFISFDCLSYSQIFFNFAASNRLFPEAMSLGDASLPKVWWCAAKWMMHLGIIFILLNIIDLHCSSWLSSPLFPTLLFVPLLVLLLFNLLTHSYLSTSIVFMMESCIIYSQTQQHNIFILLTKYE